MSETTKHKLEFVHASIIKAIEKGGRVFHGCYLPDILALMSSGMLSQVKSTHSNGDGTHTLEVR